MSIIRNLIEYYGIASYLPEEKISFTQINIEDEISSIACNLKIKEICKVYSRTSVNDTKVVKTLRGQSLEGISLTGAKVIVSGEVIYKIEFIADNEENSIHTLNHSIPYTTSLVAPEDIIEDSLVNVEAFIEDINISQIDEISIFLSSILLITIE